MNLNLNYVEERSAFSPELIRRLEGKLLHRVLEASSQKKLVVERYDVPSSEIPLLVLENGHTLHGLYGDDLVRLPGNSIRLGGVLTSPDINMVFKGPLSPVYSHLPYFIRSSERLTAHFNHEAVIEEDHLQRQFVSKLPVIEPLLIKDGSRYVIADSKGFPFKMVSEHKRERLIQDFNSRLFEMGYKFAPKHANNPHIGLYQFGTNGNSHLLASGFPNFEKIDKK